MLVRIYGSALLFLACSIVAPNAFSNNGTTVFPCPPMEHMSFVAQGGPAPAGWQALPGGAVDLVKGKATMVSCKGASISCVYNSTLPLPTAGGAGNPVLQGPSPNGFSCATPQGKDACLCKSTGVSTHAAQ